MSNKITYKWLGFIFLTLSFSACVVPVTLIDKKANTSVPASYNNSQDSTNTAKVKWKDYFTDPNLSALIDVALQNNQELNITLQEIEIARNEIQSRKGEYLPFVNLGGGAGAEKVSRYTSQGASDAMSEIKPGKETPDILPNTYFGAFAHWEVDIWHKLRNARKVAVTNYLASTEGKNFLVTNLVAEIARSYYELMALDNHLEIIQKNIVILNNALAIIKQEKDAAKVTELAVRRFEAEVFKTKSLQYEIQQKVVETENRINFLVGRYPQPVQRSSQGFNELVPHKIYAGLPSQLLENRPDIKQAELKLVAAKLDISVAKANFYPSLGLSASLGFRSYNPLYLANLPEALMSSLAGDLAGPLINKNAIIATYKSANSKQIQAVYDFERTILNAYIEVSNQLSNIDNLEKKYNMKNNQVQALTQSTDISLKLFKSARADYMEVLLTQRDVLESRMELVETKMMQMNALVNTYRALGGGWN
ncbi:efflux transporter, outer membrane factor (OMF) lipoprotein, NodT family [Pseudarcicella hirudinis]|uniref:Efflux transporter, outer membrane factor (OMF) lipoprotein, NodT family n=1 Tax=Pseudarcicella hirudinis TaxID=1079859 RepID=A0A1I5SNW3_9BACT|nr:TolC family protein [Pseudarcicella hirudinis]SFP72433.1 efflux transporter, outer membrane factor (OMF) lipoprotein, NodT family [Pseudarcicella hirudinis]